MLSDLWTTFLNWAGDKVATLLLVGGLCLAAFLFGGCAGCEVERHRPHWFNAIGCGRPDSPEPALAK